MLVRLSLKTRSPATAAASRQIFACFHSLLTHGAGLGRVSASEVEGVRRNMYLPSTPTCTRRTTTCTHRSVHCVPTINLFSTLRQQNSTWVGIECRSLRDQRDSVSTGVQHQRFATLLNSSTRNGVKTGPKREFQK